MQNTWYSPWTLLFFHTPSNVSTLNWYLYTIYVYQRLIGNPYHDIHMHILQHEDFLSDISF